MILYYVTSNTYNPDEYDGQVIKPSVYKHTMHLDKNKMLFVPHYIRMEHLESDDKFYNLGLHSD